MNVRGRLTDRWVRIMSGLVGMVLLAGATTFAVKAATGALRPVYHLHGTFDAAGQGLIRDSDVKIHGVAIGRVTKVRLRDGRARVTLEIRGGERIPVDARATIRPKTLFGEKFVDIDPGPNETDGPILGDEDVIRRTVGGFELERVLAQAYPILEAIDPAELAVVVDTLAEGGRGQGEKIDQLLADFAAVAEVQARHDADTRQFLDDFALLSESLAASAGDLASAAGSLADALPELNARGDGLAEFLDQASRLSADLADVLEANRPFLRKSVTEGGKTVQLLHEERLRLPGLVTGLRQFLQVLAEAAGNEELDQPDGTRLAAIKFVFGGGSPCGRTTEGCPIGAETPAEPADPVAPSSEAAPLVPGLPALPPLVPPGIRVDGAGALVQVLGQLLGGLYGERSDGAAR